MSGGQPKRCLIVGLLIGGFLSGYALAAEDQDALARLEAQLEAQQKRIDALQQQVIAAQQQDLDQARTEVMKQQIREVLSEKEFRESLMPTSVQAGYDKGFYIRSSDDKFQIKFNGQMQMRYTYYSTRKENRYLAPGFRRHDRSGFDFARLRFRFSGHAYTKDLTYLLELDSSASGQYDTTALYAWVNYRFVDEFQIMAGIFRLASTRVDFSSTSTMQFPEYPMMNSVFGLVRGTGVRFWGKLFEKRVDYYLDVVNSLGSANTYTITNDEDLYANGHDNNPGIVFHVIWHALTGSALHPPGDPIGGHFASGGDMEYHTEPALDLGFHYAYTEDIHDGTLRIPFPRKTFFRDGGFGLTSSEGLQIHQFGLDGALKWAGFSITGEYAMRLLDVRSSDRAPFTPLFLLTGEQSTTAQHGAYVQAGYFLPIPGLERKIEAVARIEGISALASGQEGTWVYTGGLNYYIHGHNVKIQTDVTKVSETPISSGSYSLANVNDDALIWRVQLQVAF